MVTDPGNGHLYLIGGEMGLNLASKDIYTLSSLDPGAEWQKIDMSLQTARAYHLSTVLLDFEDFEYY